VNRSPAEHVPHGFFTRGAAVKHALPCGFA
jgi:hypothetical protein